MVNPMTPTTLAAALLRDVPRYACTNAGDMEDDPFGKFLFRNDVLAALTAALDGVDERAGEVLERLRAEKSVISTTRTFPSGDERDMVLVPHYGPNLLANKAADLITALLAQNAALRAERDALAAGDAEATRLMLGAQKRMREYKARAVAAEAVAEKLRGASIETYYAKQVEWSRETFGPALRTKGIIDHIMKELREIAADPHDLSEWIDVVILAMDGFWRHGGKPEDLMPALLAKQAKNMARTWPDWRGMSEDAAIEHDRSKDDALTTEATDDPR